MIRPTWTSVGVLVAVLLLSAAPTITSSGTALGAGPAGTARLAADPRPLDNVTAAVTWDGANVSSASAAGSAFTIVPGQTVAVWFNYSSAAGSPSVANATLDLRYLGLTLSTESVLTRTVAGAGHAELNWSFGSLIFLTEGVYEVDAELFDANGSPVFIEPFYVDAKTPYVLSSTIAFFAAVLAVVEAYWIVTTVQRRTGRARRYRVR